MTTIATTRVLVAGVGNVFYGDDSFGVEVARTLAGAPPPGADVRDFGIRALHLAYELLAPCALCVIADCMPRGGDPGTLYVLAPDEVEAAPIAPVTDGHSVTVPGIFAALRQLGGQPPRTLVVGCEPASVEPHMGLSTPVARAVPEAVALIRRLITEGGGP